MIDQGSIGYSEIYFMNDIIMLLFSLFALSFLIINTKKYQDRIVLRKFYVIIGGINLILTIISFIYYNFDNITGIYIYQSSQSMATLQLVFVVILFSIVRISTFGILLIIVGIKNGNSIKEGNCGHLLIISGIFFITGQFFLINSNITSSYSYLGESYSFSIVYIYILNGIAGMFFTFMGYIFWSKFSSRNEDSFRKVFSILSMIGAFLPSLLLFVSMYYSMFLYY